MAPASFSWTLEAPQAAGCSVAEGECTVASALGRCGPLYLRSVLFVDDGAGVPTEAVRYARREGARVTALSATSGAERARSAGAEVVLDPERTDPAWYRGAWSVIVDPAGRLGFRHALPSLAPGGVYLTSTPSIRDRMSALFSRLGGGPRLLGLR